MGKLAGKLIKALTFFCSGIFLISLFSLAMIGCEPVLERQNIPLMAGIRLSENTFPPEIHQNMVAMRRHGLDHLLIEMPILADTGALLLPVIPQHALQDLPMVLDSLKKRNYTWSVALTPNNRKSIFPLHAPPSPETWFAGLETITGSLIWNSRPWPPVRIILGTDLNSIETEKTLLDAYVNRVHEQTRLPVYYSVSADRVKDVPYWSRFDGIGIIYPPAPEKNYKKYCRKLNREVSQLALETRLPVLILGANLIGDDKTLILKNRQRFWDEGVKLDGICLNTLYPRISLTDTSSYFKLRNDAEMEGYLQKYLHRSSE